MNKEKFQDVKYVRGDREARKLVGKPEFITMDDLEGEAYEVIMKKKSIKLNLPTQLGYFILQYAKLRMLEFYYDCIDKFVDRSKFQLLEMDTDSLYLAFAGKSFEDLIPKEKRVEFETERHTWFPRTQPLHAARFDKRTPGLFKEEYRGTKMVCLSAKTYCIEGEMGIKFSSKGANKRSVSDPMQIMRNVLETGIPESTVNRGIKRKGDEMVTYTQKRRCFGYEYFKRKVHRDGVSTDPLDL